MAELHPAPDKVARVAAEICERLGLEYAIIGGLAVAAYGIARLTDDADLVVALDKSEPALDGFLDELAAAGFRLNPEAVRRRFARGPNLFPTWLGLTRIDFMLRRPDAYWQDALTHRRRLVVDGSQLWVASPEDVIALKLAAGRPEDLKDVRAILNLKRYELDRPRLRATVARFAERLEKPDMVADLDRRLAELDATPDGLPPEER